MNKKPASKSAFFNPQVFIGFAICAIGVVFALFAFALYPGGNAFARQDQSNIPEAAQNRVPALVGKLSQEPPGKPAVSVTSLQPNGNVDLGLLGVRPLPNAAAAREAGAFPDSAAIGTGKAFMQITNDIVNQSTTAAFAVLSTGWTPGENVQGYVNGVLNFTFASGSFGTGTPIGYLGVTFASGAGFGYLNIEEKGVTSGKVAGGIIQVAPTGPYLPGVAGAPHAENTSGTSPAFLFFGTGYPVSSTVQRFRNGVVNGGTTATGTAGSFFIGVTPANNGDTSAVWSVDTVPGTAGSMNGTSMEERSDAGGPQVGDLNSAWAFVDRAVLDSATGGTFAVVGEGFTPGENVVISTCSTAPASVTADSNGGASFFVTAPPGAGAYNCVLTGGTSTRVARASVLAHADSTNRRGLIVAPSGVSSGSGGSTVTVLADKLPANAPSNVYLDGVLQGTTTTNSSGFGTFTITKPTPTPGFITHEVGWLANPSATPDSQATVLLLFPSGPTPTPASPTPTATPTPGCENYGITNTFGSIVTATTDIGNHGDDADTAIALPFPVTLYGNTYNAARAGSNGFLSLVSFSSTTFYTGCMPNASFSYTIFPWQVDQETTNTGAYPPGNGIYTLVTGTAPFRTFYVEWRTCQYDTGTACLANSGANYEVVFQEGVSNFSIVYGTFGTADATVGAIGVQGSGITQYSQSQCNAGKPAFSKQIYTQCPPATPTPSGTPSPTPTATATATIPPTPTITPPPTVCTLSEGFDVITTLIPAGWSMINNSVPVGTTGWFQGVSSIFPSQSGAPDSFISANFNNTTGANTISNWLLTPPVTLQNGAQFAFWTRTITSPAFADRLQVRYSRNGTSQNVGVGPTGVGDFGTVPEGGTGNGALVLDINPTYLLTGPGSYPNAWTQFSVTLSGITSPGKGRLAFRYFVEDGGPAGNNSERIGIDTFVFDCNGGIPTPTPSPSPSPTPTPTPTPCLTFLTQSVSQTPTPGSVACGNVFGHAENSYWRSFNMLQHAGGQEYKVTSVSFAVESTFHPTPAPGTPTPTPGAGTPTPTPAATPGTQPVTVRLYAQTSGAFPAGTRTQLASQEVYLADQALTLVTVPLVATVPAGTTELIMEVFTPDGELNFNKFYIGSNAAGQYQSGYISAAACSIPTPTDLASIGFPNMHMILNVNGACATPTPPPTVSISGTVTYCSGPTPNPVAGVTMTLTGGPGGSTVTAANGTYSFTGLPSGLNYTVTPSKAARPQGTSGINAVDVLAVQKHFLQIPPALLVCHLLAGDVTPPLGGNPSGVDVLAIQKFFLQVAGSASTGFYNFSPANRTYTALGTNQTGQDFEARILGDVIGGFVVPRPGGGGGSEAAASEDSSRELPATVAAIALPDVGADQANDFIAAVRTSAIDANHKLVGFQGDFTFDERVVTFASQPVSGAGLTGSNWNVSGNVLPGAGPMRTLRIAAFSHDFTPLKGEGTLFNLNMIRVGQGAQSTPLTWAPSPDQFMFIDADLNTQKAGNAAPGSVTSRPSQR